MQTIDTRYNAVIVFTIYSKLSKQFYTHNYIIFHRYSPRISFVKVIHFSTTVKISRTF